MLRILLLLVLVYLLYRLLSWIKRVKPRYPSPARGPVIDEMKACPFCGTYNPSRSALAKKGLYFCNEGCHEAFHKERA